MTLKLRSLPLATLPMKNWLQNLHHRGPAWHTTTVDVDVIYEHSSKLMWPRTVESTICLSIWVENYCVTCEENAKG